MRACKWVREGARVHELVRVSVGFCAVRTPTRALCNVQVQ